MHLHDAPAPQTVAPSNQDASNNPGVPERRAPESRAPESRAPESRVPESRVPGSRVPSLALRLRGVEHLIGEQIADGIADVLADFDITPERWRVMAALAVEPNQTMTQLSRVSVLPPASLTRHVDRLVARGLVERTITPEDRRRVTAALTDAGRQAWDQVEEREREVLADLRTRSGSEHFDVLIAELERLQDLLTS